MKRVITAALAALGVFAYLSLPQPDPICFEDMPCWDCSSMGNQLCKGDTK